MYKFSQPIRAICVFLAFLTTIAFSSFAFAADDVANVSITASPKTAYAIGTVFKVRLSAKTTNEPVSTEECGTGGPRGWSGPTWTWTPPSGGSIVSVSGQPSNVVDLQLTFGAVGPKSVNVKAAVSYTSNCGTRSGSKTQAVNVTVVAIQSLSATGATVTSDNANYYVTRKGSASDFVVVQGVLNPSVSGLPTGLVTWTGGQIGANQLQRKVPKSAVGAVTITASVGTSSKSITVHVVDATALPATNTLATLTHTLGGASNPGGNFGLTVVTIGQQGVAAPTFVINAHLEGVTWRFRLVSVSHSYLVAVNGQGRTDIASGTDPDITATSTSKAAVITDLTPPGAGATNGPPRTTYWSQTITQAHEQAHVDRFYNATFWGARMRTFEDEVEAKTVAFLAANTATQSVASVVAQLTPELTTRITELHGEADTAEITGSEAAAHGVSNPMYTTLINSIP